MEGANQFWRLRRFFGLSPRFWECLWRLGHCWLFLSVHNTSNRPAWHIKHMFAMKMPFVPWTQVPVPRNLVICVNFKGKQIENISPNYFSWSITEKCKTSVNCDDIEDNAVVVCGLYSGSLPFSVDFLTDNFWGRSTRRPSWSWKKKIITKRKEKRIIEQGDTQSWGICVLQLLHVFPISERSTKWFSEACRWILSLLATQVSHLQH